MSPLTESCLLVLDWDITASSRLVLLPNEVRNLLVLCLLNSTLIVLWALSEKLLLDEVDTSIKKMISMDMKEDGEEGRTCQACPRSSRSHVLHRRRC